MQARNAMLGILHVADELVHAHDAGLSIAVAGAFTLGPSQV